MSLTSVDSGPLHVKPEVDLNLTTEANRVLYVLNKLISRAKLVGSLHELLKNDGELLCEYVDSNIRFRINQIYDSIRYNAADPTTYQSDSLGSIETGSRQNINESRIVKRAESSTEHSKNNIADDSESGFSLTLSSGSEVYESKKLRQNQELTDLIYKLEKISDVKELAEKMEKTTTPEMRFFIKSLIEFKNRMEVCLLENAAQYKIREKYMRETFEKNEKIKQEIEKLEEELLVTKTDANVCLIGRNILIKRHQNKIEQIRHKSQEATEKKVNESEKAMVNSWKTSMATQENLKKDFVQASEKYSNLLRDHLATEKILRSKRSKVENQVLGWIQKFDQDIGEKQAEEEEIQALLDNETKEVNEIQKKLDEQEEEYDELMQEKAQYEEEMLDRKLYQFIIKRSARRIQRTYRLYKARKLAKKLAKKGKKGKKKGKN